MCIQGTAMNQTAKYPLGMKTGRTCQTGTTKCPYVHAYGRKGTLLDGKAKRTRKGICHTRRRERGTLIDLVKQIEDSDYWDARVMKLECNYFCYEVEMVFEDIEKDIRYYFTGCYQVKTDHITACDKVFPYKELSYAQIPYFMQAVDVNKISRAGRIFKEFVINMFPMMLYMKLRKQTNWNCISACFAMQGGQDNNRTLWDKVFGYIYRF